MSDDKQPIAPPVSDSGEPPRPRRSGVRATLLAVLGFTGCGALGYYYWQLFQQHREQSAALADARTEADSCAGELDETRVAARTCETDRSACEGERTKQAAKAEELERSQQELQENLQTTASELESLRKLKLEAEKGAQAFADLKAKLAEMINSKQLEVRRRDGRMILQLPAEVLFASGSAELSASGKVALIKLSAILETMTDRKLMIAGHTDSMAPAKGSKLPTNWALSTARAVTVTELLVEAGLDPKNLVASGYGEFAPIADNDTEEGRRQNRRIEIALLPELADLPGFEDELPPPADG